MGEALGSSGSSIDSSNKGFQLLKKHGWKEGTGLGISEQGRLDPVQAYVKNNKRGLGAEKKKKTAVGAPNSGENNANANANANAMEPAASSGKQKKKTKALSKRMRKILELEKRLQENEFDRAFRREFWADNV